ncbi:MAG: hypothetical protein QGF53_06305 [Alphaproteobacteria bacterium]|nr:hypothetical protein [Alphaproteobacteria bacterium]
MQPPQGLHGAQALQAAAHGLQPPQPWCSANAALDAPMAAATASGNTVLVIKRLRVDFMVFPLTIHSVSA